jgi:hypothetical protein
MNDPSDPKARLLAETFHGDWSEGVPASFARAAARVARRRASARHALGASLVAVLMLAAAFAFFRRSASPARPEVQAMAAAAQAGAPASGYEILSDDELLAQVRDRPLLAVRRADGTREIVVLASGSE